MALGTDVPVDLYIAAYSDPDGAQEDWENVKDLAKEKAITVEVLLLVSRDAGGKIREKDNAYTIGVGTALGTAGDLLIGLIFPPALVPSNGAGVGGLVSHHDKKELKAEVANDLPVGSSGIVALLDEHWVAAVERALSKADNVSKHEVDRSSLEQARAGAPKAAPAKVA